MTPAAAGAAEGPARWADALWNPKPDTDDVALPMPCGGAMAFRRVEVPSDGPLGDYKVTLGGTDETAAFAENRHTDHLAGAFEAGKAARYYLMAKYEASELQVQALSGTCPQPSMRLRLPKVNVTWFEAVAFADAYSQWLRANAADRLPKDGQEAGYLRLPTEAEWEFAARGGTRVPPAEFEERTFPMPEGMARYVWFQGSQSANGKLQLTGLLLANPLGLHDILGNADEMVWEPFRLNRVTRAHGQAGGFVVRGGNLFTSEADIRSAYRQEQPFYDSQGARRSASTGFRLVVTAPVLTSPARLREVQAAWSKLGTGAGGLAGPALADPVEELGVIVKATDDERVRRRLQDLQTTMRGNIAARDEQRDRAARVLLRLGAFLGRKLADDARAIDQLAAVYEARTKSASADDALAKRYKGQLDTEKSVLSDNLKYYADTVLRAAGDYTAEVLSRQNAVLAVELKNNELPDLVRLAEMFLGHTQAYRASGKPDRDQWLNELKTRN
ncbi:hypothetical protein TSO221_25720 [Azospirillum sp. TSO22-1]|nr:hypothetical protein TSO221_25720 [Azospirillum sp. TSO22-1]